MSTICKPTPITVTYSPAYTLVPTYECFNRCSYCNFRVDPNTDEWLTLEQASKILNQLKKKGICEILILSGEVHPKSDRRSQWIEHIYQLCDYALELGFLPHTNAGPLSFEEMTRLKPVNASMGLMLEQITPTLLSTVHRHAPSKNPTARLQQLEWAGKLHIPFTTGLLVGIGETEHDWYDTLEAIAHVHQTWGHIQEVILQPHQTGTRQAQEGNSFQLHLMPKLVSLARQLLPNTIAIQIPPNLVQHPSLLLACIEAGASDFGGIGPKDEVNPDYPHLSAQYLTTLLSHHDIDLTTRLPVYAHYEQWLSPRLRQTVTKWHQFFNQKQLTNK